MISGSEGAQPCDELSKATPPKRSSPEQGLSLVLC